MRIIKRNGASCDFDVSKIVDAVSKACIRRETKKVEKKIHEVELFSGVGWDDEDFDLKLYCAKHLPLHLEVTRPASKRGYGSRWQKASKAYLQSHPLCVACVKMGRYTKATVVDHIVPHRGDQKLFWDQSNWQALCKKCHDRKTLTEDINPTYRY